ncbi:MAG TPA: acyl-CoA dehydrogenase [Trebonia sp.]|nr:acyl-CoA dehydrogenase [Trebonia sp.]
MNLLFSEAEEATAEAARAFFTRALPLEAVRAAEAAEPWFPAEVWRELLAQAWLPPLLGPDGAGPDDLISLAIVFEAMGSAAFSSPFLGSCVLAPLILRSSGPTDTNLALIRELTAGRQTAALALHEAQAGDEWVSPRSVTGAADGPGWRIRGTKHLVPFAAQADVLLVTADLDDQGPAVIRIARAAAEAAGQLRLRKQEVIGGDPCYRVDLDGLQAGPEDLIVPLPNLDRVLHDGSNLAALLETAYATGLCERALSMTVKHAGSREQFGQPIGAFQAVAFHCAGMRLEVDACRYLTYKAAARVDGKGNGDLELSSAVAYAAQAVRQNLRDAHQVFGARGFSREYDLYLLAERAKAFELSNGTRRKHLRRVAELIGL